jgi:hypothetical protein
VIAVIEVTSGEAAAQARRAALRRSNRRNEVRARAVVLLAAATLVLCGAGTIVTSCGAPARHPSHAARR